MTVRDAIKGNVDTAHFITTTYLQDMSDADLLVRSVPGTNHIAWQLGHIIASEHEMISALGFAMPELPSGFAESHSREAATSDDPKKFATKAQYIELFKKLHDATIAAMNKCSDADLDKPAPEKMREYAPTFGAVFNLIGQHELMHAGQYVPIRRKLGKPVVM